MKAMTLVWSAAFRHAQVVERLVVFGKPAVAQTDGALGVTGLVDGLGLDRVQGEACGRKQQAAQKRAGMGP